MVDYWRKKKDWSGERVGDERIVRRLLRIKENQHDKYVSLYMDGTGITEIPVEIWKFEKLEELWASYNKITTLPEEITWLIHLKNLRLESNRFESLPACIGRLPRLEHLGMNGNRLKTLPPELCNLKNLESLYLADNPDLPAEWAQDFKTKEETQAFLAHLAIELKNQALSGGKKSAAKGKEEEAEEEDKATSDDSVPRDDSAPVAIETVEETPEEKA